MTSTFSQVLLLAGATSLLAGTTANAQGAVEPASVEFTRECGVASADIYLRDLSVNSERAMGYCSVDNDGWPLGFESTLGISVGVDEQVNNLNFVLKRPMQVGPIQLEVSGGAYHYWDLENTVWLAGSEATVELFDGVSVGGSYTQYFGDYEDSTTSVFGLVEAGGLDLEVGYSTLDSGPQGPYAEAGYSWNFRGVQPSLVGQWVDTGDEQTFAVVVRVNY